MMKFLLEQSFRFMETFDIRIVFSINIFIHVNSLYIILSCINKKSCLFYSLFSFHQVNSVCNLKKEILDWKKEIRVWSYSDIISYWNQRVRKCFLKIHAQVHRFLGPNIFYNTVQLSTIRRYFSLNSSHHRSQFWLKILLKWSPWSYSVFFLLRHSLYEDPQTVIRHIKKIQYIRNNETC